MNIFENLENLNVSEECFGDILDIVEAIFEGWAETHNMGDLDTKVKNSIASRKKKYEEAVDSGASPEEINKHKIRYHRANVLNHTSTLGNKKERRSAELVKNYGENPSVKTLRDVKQGEEPELTNKYFREVRNLGKPEAQKENPNVENIKFPLTDKQKEEREMEREREKEERKSERESKKTREKRERDAIDAHIKNELEELKQLNSFLKSPNAGDSASYQRRINRRNELQRKFDARNRNSSFSPLMRRVYDQFSKKSIMRKG